MNTYISKNQFKNTRQHTRLLKLEAKLKEGIRISRVNTGQQRRLLACAQGRQDHADAHHRNTRKNNNIISVHIAKFTTPNHAVGLSSSAFITSSDTTSHIVISSTEHRISWATSPLTTERG
jgi:hypothetical protein